MLTVLFNTAFHVTMRPSLEDQKRIFIENIQKKIRMAFSFEEKKLSILCTNWSDWDSLTHYIENPCREFETEVFPNMIFIEEDMLDIIIIANFSQDILFLKAFKEDRFVNADQLKINREVDKIKWSIKRNPRPIKGILQSDAGPVMIVANPIMTGSSSDPVIGVLMLGRFIDHRMLGRISNYVMEDIRTFSFNDSQLIEFWKRRMQSTDLSYNDTGEKLNIYCLLRDINNRPADILYTTTDNRIFRVVGQHVITFIILGIISIFLLGSVLYISIHSKILKRMLNISDTMKRIEGWKDLSCRIDVDNKKDELSSLVSNINAMLDKLENEKIKRENAEKAMITHGKLASIGRLTSCISHEVNNPLLAISNSIQAIKKISKNKSPIFKEAIEISEAEIKRIRDIISSLLDFHRFEKEEYCLSDVGEILKESLNVAKWGQKLDSIKVIAKYDNNCIVYGSPSRLKQVFLNFIINAADAMKMNEETKPRILQLGTDTAPKSDADVVEIHIIDSGPGIPDNVKKHLFEPFVSTKEVKGVGLGLYISYKIIDKHHGSIFYDEKYEGGTHFIISLPKNGRYAGE